MSVVFSGEVTTVTRAMMLGVFVFALSCQQVALTATPDSTEAPTPEDIRQALLSIVVHAYPQAFVGMRGTVTPLETATRVIDNIGDPTGPYRRRQAIVKLSVGRFENSSFPDDVRAALEILEAPIDQIQDAMQSLPLGTTPQEAAQFLFILLASLGLGETCASSVSTDTGYDADSDSAIAVFRVTGVPRNLNKVATALDPQNWSQCFGPWITKSFVVDGSTGSYQPIPVMSSPTPATTWQGVLYEQWENANIGVYWLKNYFHIDAHRSTTMFYYEYDLADSWEMDLNGSLITKPMKRNEGYMSARKESGLVTVTGLKLLQYYPAAYAGSGINFNMTAAYLLREMGESAEIAACTCEPQTNVSVVLWWYRFWEGMFDFFGGS